MPKVFLLAKDPRTTSAQTTHIDRFEDLRIPVEGFGEPVEAVLRQDQVDHLERDPYIIVLTEKRRAEAMAAEAARKKAEAEAEAEAARQLLEAAKAKAEWEAEQEKQALEDAKASAKAGK